MIAPDRSAGADSGGSWTVALAILPLAKLALHLGTFRGYGWFRDELYYLACAARLDFGYVDHPPLAPLLLRLVTEVLGESLFAVRLIPAVAGALTILLVGLMARDMGGGSFAQILAMISALVAPQFLGTCHVFSMNCLDVLIWAAAGWWIIRLLGAPSPGRWIVLGVLLGLGLQNKISVLWLGFGLLAGLALSPARRLLATPGPWMAGALAGLLFLPHVLWQAAWGWPTVEFIRNATSQKMLEVNPVQFVQGQLGMMNRWNALVWAAGLGWLLLSRRAREFRLLGWAWLAVFLLLMLSGSSRPGYLAPAYTWLMAAGGVAWSRAARLLEGRLPARAHPVVRATPVALLLAAGALTAPFALPILPVESYIAYARSRGVLPSTSEKKSLSDLKQFYADMHGWESIVETLAAAHRSLPPGEREKAAIFTNDYGVAGAVDRLGRARGLPNAISGHNNYWIWGPGGFTGEVVIVMGGSREEWEELFGSVETAGRTDCGYCMPYENNVPVWIGRNLKGSLAAMWPRAKHFD